MIASIFMLLVEGFMFHVVGKVTAMSDGFYASFSCLNIVCICYVKLVRLIPLCMF